MIFTLHPASFEFKDKILRAWFSLIQDQRYVIQAMLRCPRVCLNIIYILWLLATAKVG